MAAPGSPPRRARQPVLPSVYALPWDRSVSMFPQTARGTSRTPMTARVGTTDGFKPRTLRSSFGEQTSSERRSPEAVQLGGGPNRFPTFGKFSFRGPPGPQFPAYSTFGLQPRSDIMTASRPKLGKDERWGSIERFQRATATPGPGTYNPCV